MTASHPPTRPRLHTTVPAAAPKPHSDPELQGQEIDSTGSAAQQPADPSGPCNPCLPQTPQQDSNDTSPTHTTEATYTHVSSNKCRSSVAGMTARMSNCVSTLGQTNLLSDSHVSLQQHSLPASPGHCSAICAPKHASALSAPAEAPSDPAQHAPAVQPLALLQALMHSQYLERMAEATPCQPSLTSFTPDPHGMKMAEATFGHESLSRHQSQRQDTAIPCEHKPAVKSNLDTPASSFHSLITSTLGGSYNPSTFHQRGSVRLQIRKFSGQPEFDASELSHKDGLPDNNKYAHQQSDAHMSEVSGAAGPIARNFKSGSSPSRNQHTTALLQAGSGNASSHAGSGVPLHPFAIMPQRPKRPAPVDISSSSPVTPNAQIQLNTRPNRSADTGTDKQTSTHMRKDGSTHSVPHTNTVATAPAAVGGSVPLNSIGPADQHLKQTPETSVKDPPSVITVTRPEEPQGNLAPQRTSASQGKEGRHSRSTKAPDLLPASTAAHAASTQVARQSNSSAGTVVDSKIAAKPAVKVATRMHSAPQQPPSTSTVSTSNQHAAPAPTQPSFPTFNSHTTFPTSHDLSADAALSDSPSHELSAGAALSDMGNDGQQDDVASVVLQHMDAIKDMPADTTDRLPLIYEQLQKLAGHNLSIDQREQLLSILLRMRYYDRAVVTYCVSHMHNPDLPSRVTIRRARMLAKCYLLWKHQVGAALDPWLDSLLRTPQHHLNREGQGKLMLLLLIYTLQQMPRNYPLHLRLAFIAQDAVAWGKQGPLLLSELILAICHFAHYHHTRRTATATEAPGNSSSHVSTNSVSSSTVGGRITQQDDTEAHASGSSSRSDHSGSSTSSSQATNTMHRHTSIISHEHDSRGRSGKLASNRRSGSGSKAVDDDASSSSSIAEQLHEHLLAMLNQAVPFVASQLTQLQGYDRNALLPLCAACQLTTPETEPMLAPLRAQIQDTLPPIFLQPAAAAGDARSVIAPGIQDEALPSDILSGTELLMYAARKLRKSRPTPLLTTLACDAIRTAGTAAPDTQAVMQYVEAHCKHACQTQQGLPHDVLHMALSYVLNHLRRAQLPPRTMQEASTGSSSSSSSSGSSSATADTTMQPALPTAMPGAQAPHPNPADNKHPNTTCARIDADPTTSLAAGRQEPLFDLHAVCTWLRNVVQPLDVRTRQLMVQRLLAHVCHGMYAAADASTQLVPHDGGSIGISSQADSTPSQTDSGDGNLTDAKAVAGTDGRRELGVQLNLSPPVLLELLFTCLTGHTYSPAISQAVAAVAPARPPVDTSLTGSALQLSDDATAGMSDVELTELWRSTLTGKSYIPRTAFRALNYASDAVHGYTLPRGNNSVPLASIQPSIISHACDLLRWLDASERYLGTAGSMVATKRAEMRSALSAACRTLPPHVLVQVALQCNSLHVLGIGTLVSLLHKVHEVHAHAIESQAEANVSHQNDNHPVSVATQPQETNIDSTSDSNSLDPSRSGSSDDGSSMGSFASSSMGSSSRSGSSDSGSSTDGSSSSSISGANMSTGSSSSSKGLGSSMGGTGDAMSAHAGSSSTVHPSSSSSSSSSMSAAAPLEHQARRWRHDYAMTNLATAIAHCPPLNSAVNASQQNPWRLLVAVAAVAHDTSLADHTVAAAIKSVCGQAHAILAGSETLSGRRAEAMLRQLTPSAFSQLLAVASHPQYGDVEVLNALAVQAMLQLHTQPIDDTLMWVDVLRRDPLAGQPSEVATLTPHTPTSTRIVQVPRGQDVARLTVMHVPQGTQPHTAAPQMLAVNTTDTMPSPASDSPTAPAPAFKAPALDLPASESPVMDTVLPVSPASEAPGLNLPVRDSLVSAPPAWTRTPTASSLQSFAVAADATLQEATSAHAVTTAATPTATGAGTSGSPSMADPSAARQSASSASMQHSATADQAEASFGQNENVDVDSQYAAAGSPLPTAANQPPTVTNQQPTTTNQLSTTSSVAPSTSSATSAVTVEPSSTAQPTGTTTLPTNKPTLRERNDALAMRALQHSPHAPDVAQVPACQDWFRRLHLRLMAEDFVQSDAETVVAAAKFLSPYVGGQGKAFTKLARALVTQHERGQAFYTPSELLQLLQALAAARFYQARAVDTLLHLIWLQVDDIEAEMWLKMVRELAALRCSNRRMYALVAEQMSDRVASLRVGQLLALLQDAHARQLLRGSPQHIQVYSELVNNLAEHIRKGSLSPDQLLQVLRTFAQFPSIKQLSGVNARSLAQGALALTRTTSTSTPQEAAVDLRRGDASFDTTVRDKDVLERAHVTTGARQQAAAHANSTTAAAAPAAAQTAAEGQTAAHDLALTSRKAADGACVTHALQADRNANPAGTQHTTGTDVLSSDEHHPSILGSSNTRAPPNPGPSDDQQDAEPSPTTTAGLLLDDDMAAPMLAVTKQSASIHHIVTTPWGATKAPRSPPVIVPPPRAENPDALEVLLVGTVCHHLAGRLKELTPQQVTETAQIVSAIRFVQGWLVQGLCAVVCQGVGVYSTLQLAHILAALSRMPHSNDRVLLLLRRIISKDLARCTPQQLVPVVAALVEGSQQRSGPRHLLSASLVSRSLLDEAAAASLRSLCQLPFADVTMLIKSFSVLGFPDQLQIAKAQPGRMSDVHATTSVTPEHPGVTSPTHHNTRVQEAPHDRQEHTSSSQAKTGSGGTIRLASQQQRETAAAGAHGHADLQPTESHSHPAAQSLAAQPSRSTQQPGIPHLGTRQSNITSRNAATTGGTVTPHPVPASTGRGTDARVPTNHSVAPNTSPAPELGHALKTSQDLVIPKPMLSPSGASISRHAYPNSVPPTASGSPEVQPPVRLDNAPLPEASTSVQKQEQGASRSVQKYEQETARNKTIGTSMGDRPYAGMREHSGPASTGTKPIWDAILDAARQAWLDHLLQWQRQMHAVQQPPAELSDEEILRHKREALDVLELLMSLDCYDPALYNLLLSRLEWLDRIRANHV